MFFSQTTLFKLEPVISFQICVFRNHFHLNRMDVSTQPWPTEWVVYRYIICCMLLFVITKSRRETCSWPITNFLLCMLRYQIYNNSPKKVSESNATCVRRKSISKKQMLTLHCNNEHLCGSWYESYSNGRGVQWMKN